MSLTTPPSTRRHLFGIVPGSRANRKLFRAGSPVGGSMVLQSTARALISSNPFLARIASRKCLANLLLETGVVANQTRPSRKFLVRKTAGRSQHRRAARQPCHVHRTARVSLRGGELELPNPDDSADRACFSGENLSFPFTDKGDQGYYRLPILPRHRHDERAQALG